jgi:thermostable 8-oxoguanine DNA glycosylase
MIQRELTFEETDAYQLNDETEHWGDISEAIYDLPNADKEVMPGVSWGECGVVFTPAYWKIQYLMHNSGNDFTINYRLGENVLEEVVACLLGGFGLKAEMGLAAFERLVERGLIKQGVEFEPILEALKEGFEINVGKKSHYRFPNQKAKFIFEFLNRPDLNNVPVEDDLELRCWLMGVKGIGPKTASWITRNFLDSEKVAIIDIHIFRAGLAMGLFTESLNVQRDYFRIEEIFLGFCKAIKVMPSRMDALMWLQMKESGVIGIRSTY